ncbi:MAG: hypothetical protein AB7K24_07510 [Gemmataceae bacterium]
MSASPKPNPKPAGPAPAPKPAAAPPNPKPQAGAPNPKPPAAAPSPKPPAPAPGPTPPAPAPVSFQGIERWLFFTTGYKHVLLVQNCLMVLHLADQAPSAFRTSVRSDTQMGQAIAQHVMNPAENAALEEALASRVKENIDKFNRIHPDDSFQESNFNSVIYLEAINSITIRPAARTMLTVHVSDRSGPFLQRSKRVFQIEPGDGRTIEQTIENIKQGLPNLVQFI